MFRESYQEAYLEEDYRRAHELILGVNRDIKDLLAQKACETDEFEKAGHIEEGVGFMDGKAIKRLIIILRGCGCAWTQKDEGGCTMCGHYSGSSLGKTIAPEKLKKQFDDAIRQYNFRQYPMVCLYNGGSFLNDLEIEPELRRYVYRTINSNPHIKRLIIESRAEFITDESLDEIEELMPDTEVEIGLGLETRDENIRQLLLNKGTTTRDLIEAAKKFNNRKIRLLAYVLVNPPFLTEAEAIADTVDSIKFAHEIGASVVSLEAVSIQHFTLVAVLAEAGYYKPPWIWSMFEIIRRTIHLDMELRLGGFEFFPIPKEFTSNCPACNEEMIRKIHEFNTTNNINVLRDLICKENCDRIWREELKVRDASNLPRRVVRVLESIDNKKILQHLSEYGK